jgi:hypothetical protein
MESRMQAERRGKNYLNDTCGNRRVDQRIATAGEIHQEEKSRAQLALAENA